MNFKCLECGASFKKEAGLHIHVKKHGGIAAYYQKNFPNRDRLDGSLINFSNPEQYLGECFNSLKTRNIFLKGCSKKEGRDIIIHELNFDKKKYGFTHLPPQNYYILKKRAGLITCENFFESKKELADCLGLDFFYDKTLPDDFWNIAEQELDKIEIHIDTREQRPFSFSNYIINKLDFGDYCSGGIYYNKTFIDRKSLTDFKGTFGVGFDRFTKEVERAKLFNSFLFVVVESSIAEIIRSNLLGKYATNLSYAFSNVRKLCLKYPEVIQFIFCKNREEAQDITKRILYFGTDLHKCDIQYYLDKKHVGQR
jgi:hypothetical protein